MPRRRVDIVVVSKSTALTLTDELSSIGLPVGGKRAPSRKRTTILEAGYGQSSDLFTNLTNPFSLRIEFFCGMELWSQWNHKKSLVVSCQQ